MIHPILRFLPLVFAASSQALSLTEISGRLTRAQLPENLDYRVTTTVDLGSRILTTTGRIIQSGTTRQWMETDAGGNRLQIIRNGARMRMVDLATGTSQVLAAPRDLDQLALVRNPFVGIGSWLEPVNIGDGLWEVSDTTSRDRILKQSFWFSDRIGQIVELRKIGAEGDTTKILIEWGAVQGRQVPIGMRILAGSGVRRDQIKIAYTDWLFPRALPLDLFDIP